MSMIKRITGPGVTNAVSMVSADLGIVRWDPKRKCNAIMYGDNFTERYMRGEWQSPSIICYDADLNLLGIPVGTNQIVSQGNRRQLWPYEHNQNGVSTILPCDFIRIGDTWHVAVMIVGMGGLGNELRTEFHRSHNLVDWEVEPELTLNHPGHPGNVMLTFDRIGEWMYIFGTGGLARNRPIWLWRNRIEDFPAGLWEPWGMDNVSWSWGVPNEHTPILPGRYGELCFRAIQGNSVLSFFDVDRYCCSALTVVKPTDHWPGANRVDYAHGSQFPQLYGGYLTPDSQLNKLDGLKAVVSQWNTNTNDPYHCIGFADTLRAMGDVVVELPEPEPEPEPEEPMTPQQLYELLLKELAASGSTKIQDPDTGELLTLREGIEQIYRKEKGPHGLKGGRPRHPGQDDDQLGHVLNARAEGLFTQACIVALADRAGIDVKALYDQVQRSLQ
jgi:hypothetical protein